MEVVDCGRDNVAGTVAAAPTPPTEGPEPPPTDEPGMAGVGATNETDPELTTVCTGAEFGCDEFILKDGGKEVAGTDKIAPGDVTEITGGICFDGVDIGVWAVAVAVVETIGELAGFTTIATPPNKFLITSISAAKLSVVAARTLSDVYHFSSTIPV